MMVAGFFQTHGPAVHNSMIIAGAILIAGAVIAETLADQTKREGTV